MFVATMALTIIGFLTVEIVEIWEKGEELRGDLDAPPAAEQP